MRTAHTRSILALALVVSAACTSVDQTEHCVETRYGKVVNPKMSNGLNWTPFTDATCFSLRDQNFPEGGDDSKTAMEFQSRDPITLSGDVAVVYAFDPATIPQVFEAKRSQDAAEVQIMNAVREGYRSALAGWTVADIYSSRRGAIADSVRVHIQKKLANLAIIKQVFVRDIRVPAQIEQARIAATQQAQRLDQAQKQLAIDSMNARGELIKAEASASANRLQAESYSANAKLLDLEIAKALAGLCGKATTCVIGASPNSLLGVK